jgi:cytochrome oxidase Cu insertion factor (SCO1/SenC/PrrC family)
VKRRAWVLAAIVAAAIAALAVVVVIVVNGSGGTPPLNAVPINPPVPAPPTAGRDASGNLVSVPEGGRPALVTFLYAKCTTSCPLIAGEISSALDAVGPGTAGRIDIVAISVDPVGDTPKNVNAFLAVHHLAGRMSYIVGSRSTLAPLWQAWGIRAQPIDAIRSTHTALVVLIDRQGREVGTYAGAIPISVPALAADIRTLTG